MCAASSFGLIPATKERRETAKTCFWQQQRRQKHGTRFGVFGTMPPAGHVSGKPDLLAQSAWLTEQIAGWICSWREFLLQPDPNQDDLVRKLRGHESTGRPLGDKAFIQKLESLLGRPLLPAKRGPKPKTKDETLTLLDGN